MTWGPFDPVGLRQNAAELIGPIMLAAARRMLAGGRSLNEAANQLRVRPGDLDLAIWRSIGTRREAMF